MRNIAQERALDALTKIEALEKKCASADEKDKYAQIIKGLPSMIIMNGLGQSMATLLAVGKDHHKEVYGYLESWLCRNDHHAPYRDGHKLMKSITENDRNAYQRAQAEALAYLEWLKKFAVAYLEEDKNIEKDIKGGILS